MRLRLCILWYVCALLTACAPTPTSTPFAQVTILEVAPATATAAAPSPTRSLPTRALPTAQPLALGSINPLTGQPINDAAVLTRRPMIVKISNAPALVRPQAGLGTADLVYEHYTEGGLTRFSAIFYSNAPQRVGSIRSARLIDALLVPMYGGVLGFSGGSIEVEQLLFGADYGERTYKGVLYAAPYFWRDEAIEVPHNLFMNTVALWDKAAAEGYSVNDATRPNLFGMTFDSTAPSGEAGTANTLDIRYTGTRALWQYDATTGRYSRTTDGAPHLDANTNAVIAVDNVVVLYVDHQVSEIVESEWQGNKSYGLDIRLIGEGDAIVFRDGRVYGAYWSQQTRDGVLTLWAADGTAVALRPGQTWFQVVRLPAQLDATSEWVRWWHE
jgi:hypothetical protein